MANHFLESTEHFIHGGANPGGYYKAIWCRDASYILRDWFLSGRFQDVMHELLYIWSHQIRLGGEKIIYGRGSPEMNYLSQVASRRTQKQFEGALPTTIFYGFSEIYGLNPDIDSTALMVSTTSWIFDACLRSGVVLEPSFSSSPAGGQELKMSSIVSKPSTVMDFVIPKMLRAIDYLESRDIDGDGLLEQDHNEDWMDTTLRAGKIVYSQASWILALSNLSSLLSELGRKEEVHRLFELAKRTIQRVEKQLWIEEEGTYIDLQEGHHLGDSYRTLTQDISLYLIAITENTFEDVLSIQSKPKIPGPQNNHKQKTEPKFAIHANSTLDAIKNRIWKDKWPWITEKTMDQWVLHPNQYHNHTFWPWSTGIEMLARSRFERIEECNTLLSVLTSQDEEDNNLRAFYEWVDPITHTGKGAFPFKTGISALRIAIFDILCKGDWIRTP
ncbi:MAG: GH116 family glycosyl hydrolase [Thermoproteota archaeon]|nr:GH116 family glycosyl hydrolase [Thermoproteota archaeon]